MFGTSKTHLCPTEASADVRSKAVVPLLLIIQCLLLIQMFVYSLQMEKYNQMCTHLPGHLSLTDRNTGIKKENS